MIAKTRMNLGFVPGASRAPFALMTFMALTALPAATEAGAQTPLACDRPGPMIGTCTLDSALAKASGTKLRGVLLMQYSKGGENQTGLQNALVRLSNRHGFRLDRSSSSTYINDSTLAGVDLVVFNNTAADPLPDSVSLAAMRKFIETRGKGMLLAHSAASYIPCPSENLEDPGCRWMMRALRTQFWIFTPPRTPGRVYADSVVAGQVPPNATGIAAVAATRNHGKRNDETRGIFNGLPSNGGAGPLAGRAGIWEGVREEWYNYRNIPRLEGARVLEGVEYGPVNILLSLDETSQTGVNCSNGASCNNIGTFGDRPVSWTRKMGNGLAAYSNLGHSADAYTQDRVVGGETVRDSLGEKYTWRLMKYLARDFVGCMDSASPYYNAQATVARLTDSDPVDPCFGTSTLARRGGRALAGARDLGLARLEARGGVLRMTFSASGPHRVRVTDVAGKVAHAAASSEGVEARLEPGIYFVEVRDPRGARASGRVRVL